MAGGSQLLDCGWQCEEGVRECEACGEVELCSTLHFIAALHGLATEPVALDLVVAHAQVCLKATHGP